MDTLLKIGSYLGVFILGHLSYLFVPSKRRKAEVNIAATIIGFLPMKKYITRSTFHVKELERPNKNPGGIDTKGYLFELDREFHNLYFRDVKSKNDPTLVHIEINRKVLPP